MFHIKDIICTSSVDGHFFCLVVDKYLSLKLHGIASAVKVLNCAEIMSKLTCTLHSVFLN
jgi:hypothetical protein